MKDKLAKVWETCETEQLAVIFENYMKSLGVKKIHPRRKDNRNTYLIDGKSTDWNRVQCYYHKDSEKFAEENLLIVLRKRAGDYLIIGKHGERAFEVDYSGIRHYDEKLLAEILEEHKPLFDKLLKLAVPENLCEWSEDMNGMWTCSKCDITHCFTTDGPKENDTNFCPKCGRKIITIHPFRWEMDEDE